MLKKSKDKQKADYEADLEKSRIIASELDTNNTFGDTLIQRLISDKAVFSSIDLQSYISVAPETELDTQDLDVASHSSIPSNATDADGTRNIVPNSLSIKYLYIKNITSSIDSLQQTK